MSRSLPASPACGSSTTPCGPSSPPRRPRCGPRGGAARRPSPAGSPAAALPRTDGLCVDPRLPRGARGRGRGAATPTACSPARCAPPAARRWSRCRAGDGALICRVRLHDTRDLVAVVARVRRLLDLDADPVAVDAALGADPVLAPLVRKRPGLRSPGAVDGLETAVRTVDRPADLGQRRAHRARPDRRRARQRRPSPTSRGCCSPPPPHSPGSTRRRCRCRAPCAHGARRSPGLATAVCCSTPAPTATSSAPRCSPCPASGRGRRTTCACARCPTRTSCSRPTLSSATSAAELGLDLTDGRPDWAPWRSYATHHLWVHSSATAWAERHDRRGDSMRTPSSRRRWVTCWRRGTRSGMTALYLPTGKNAVATASGLGARRRRLRRSARRSSSEYFAGIRREFELPLHPRGTAFQRRAWAALREIPYGETASYGATGCGDRGARRVPCGGLANGQNPISIIVPCHRVIGADGSLIGYGGGLGAKQWLLAHEAGHAGLFALLTRPTARSPVPALLVEGVLRTLEAGRRPAPRSRRPRGRPGTRDPCAPRRRTRCST